MRHNWVHVILDADGALTFGKPITFSMQICVQTHHNTIQTKYYVLAGDRGFGGSGPDAGWINMNIYM